jgi:hypothetical protein
MSTSTTDLLKATEAAQGTTLAEDAAALRELKRTAAALDTEAKEAKAAAQQAEIEFFERMDTEGVQSIKYDGTNFVRAETVFGQVQDRSEFVAWAEENRPELLETKERKALVNELVREHLDDGAPLPPGLGFYVNQYVSQRAG